MRFLLQDELDGLEGPTLKTWSSSGEGNPLMAQRKRKRKTFGLVYRRLFSFILWTPSMESSQGLTPSHTAKRNKNETHRRWPADAGMVSFSFSFICRVEEGEEPTRRLSGPTLSFLWERFVDTRLKPLIALLKEKEMSCYARTICLYFSFIIVCNHLSF